MFETVYLIGEAHELELPIVSACRFITKKLITVVFQSKDARLDPAVRASSNHVIVFPYRERAFHLNYLLDPADTAATSAIVTFVPRFKSLRHSMLNYVDVLMIATKERSKRKAKVVEEEPEEPEEPQETKETKETKEKSKELPARSTSKPQVKKFKQAKLVDVAEVQRQTERDEVEDAHQKVQRVVQLQQLQTKEGKQKEEQKQEQKEEEQKSETKEGGFEQFPVDIPPFLSTKHSHPKDAFISMRESDHKYKVTWETGETSIYDNVSTSELIKRCFKPFDHDESITMMMNGKNWCKSKYYGMSRDEIKSEWKKTGEDASSAGRAFHAMCEAYYNGIYPCEPYSKTTEQFLNFALDNIVLDPFRSEWKVWTSSEYKITGTIDMVYRSPRRDPDNSILYLWIYDWKNSKKITKFAFRGEKGRGACAGLPNSNFFHYSLQLNVYKYILENFYAPMVVEGVEYKQIVVEKLALVVVHPSKPCYEVVPIDDFQGRVVTLFDDRKVQLRNQLHKALYDQQSNYGSHANKNVETNVEKNDEGSNECDLP